MSAYSKPRNPYAGAAPLAHRPLSAIAATAGGGVPQQRIKRVLAELVPQLDALYEQGRIGGDISVHSVGLDEFGRAHLMAASLPVQGGSQSGVPEPGYGAPELYAAGPQWQRGPWTDIYGLSAVAHALVVGKPPPSAADRLEHDTYQALAEQNLPKYELAFLAAVDRGLALDPSVRPHSMAQFAELMVFPAATASGLEVHSQAIETQAPRVVETEPPRLRQRAKWFLALLLAGCVAMGVYWWDRVVSADDDHTPITDSEPVSAASSTTEAARERGGVASADPLAATPPGPAVDPFAWPSPQGDAYPPVGEGPAPGIGAGANGGPAAQAQQPGAPAETAPPARVRVSLNIRPWGEVWINGRLRGVTPPLKTLMLAPGRYSVEIRNANLPPHRTTLVVRTGRPAIITHQFR